MLTTFEKKNRKNKKQKQQIKEVSFTMWKRYMAGPKGIFARAVSIARKQDRLWPSSTFHENSEIYSPSGLWITTCTSKLLYGLHATNRDGERALAWYPRTVNFLSEELLWNVEYQNRLRTEFGVISGLEMKMWWGYQVTRSGEDHELLAKERCLCFFVP